MQVISRDGTAIAFDRLGEGPVVVMVSGATCFRRFPPVRKEAEVLAGSFTVVSHDRRGRGDSGPATRWSLQAEVDDVEALVDAHGGTAHVYGHSSGAVIALEAALQLGDKVTGCAIYDVSSVGDAEDAASYQDLKTEVEALLAAGRNGRAVTRFLVRIGMPRVFALALPLMPGWRTMKALAPTLLHDIALTEHPLDVERYAAITTPVLAMAGGRNPPSILDNHRAVLQSIETADGPLIADESHLVKPETIHRHLAAAWL